MLTIRSADWAAADEDLEKSTLRLGFVPLLTGLVGWCPLYAIAHLSTRRDSSKEPVAA